MSNKLDCLQNFLLDLLVSTNYNLIRTIVRQAKELRKGNRIMVHSEIEVINKIRNSKDPDRAMEIATAIILDYLMQRESSQSQSAVPLPEPCAIT